MAHHTGAEAGHVRSGSRANVGASLSLLFRREGLSVIMHNLKGLKGSNEVVIGFHQVFKFFQGVIRRAGTTEDFSFGCGHRIGDGCGHVCAQCGNGRGVGSHVTIGGAQGSTHCSCKTIDIGDKSVCVRHDVYSFHA